MGFKDLAFLLPQEYQTKKVGLTIFYTFLILVVTFYFLFRKRTTIPRQAAPRRPAEDIRPKVSMNGKLLSGHDKLETLRNIGKSCRMYIVFEVRNDEEVKEIQNMLEKVETIEKYRILFCETEIGYKAIIRQLNPRLHLESDARKALEMKGYVNSITMITQEVCEGFYQIVEFAKCETLILNILNDIS